MGDRPNDPTPADPGSRPTRRPAVDRNRSGRTAGSRSSATGNRSSGSRSSGNRASGKGSATVRAAGSRPPGNRSSSARAADARSSGRPKAGAAARSTAGPRSTNSARQSRGNHAEPLAEPGEGRKGWTQNPVVLLSILTAVVVGLVVYAFVLRPEAPTASPQGGTPTTTIDPEAPGTTLPAAAFTTYTSAEDGFTIAYPKDWPLLPVGDEGGLALDAGGADAVDVRLVQRMDGATTAENLEDVKAVTDGIVGLNPTARILKQQAITVDGMPGYYYLYTFIEPETGAEGAHAHYFLFRGRNMYTLVFQALPSDGFAPLAGVFDQIAGSFKTRPDTAPPEPTASSTVPPEATTTVPG